MGGLGSDFFDYFQYALTFVLGVMRSTVIFRAYGFTVTLWDLYTKSTILIAFFDAVIFPVMSVWGLVDTDSTGIMEDIDKQNEDD